MKPYQSQFSEENDFPQQDKVKQHYIICSTPRCGSNLLGHSLYQTNQLGFPLEYFSPINFREWCKRLSTTGVIDTLQKVKRIRTSPNGIFGCKLHFDHYEELANNYVFEDLFPDAKLIYIQRKDLLGQAVSLAKARGSGVWISNQNESRKVNYSRKSIDNALKKITHDNARWEYVISSRNWSHLRVYYEDFLKTPLEVIKNVTEFLGFEYDPGLNAESFKLPEKQRDKTNNEYRDRYLQETQRMRIGEELPFLRSIEKTSFTQMIGYICTSSARGIKKLTRSLGNQD